MIFHQCYFNACPFSSSLSTHYLFSHFLRLLDHNAPAGAFARTTRLFQVLARLSRASDSHAPAVLTVPHHTSLSAAVAAPAGATARPAGAHYEQLIVQSTFPVLLTACNCHTLSYHMNLSCRSPSQALQSSLSARQAQMWPWSTLQSSLWSLPAWPPPARLLLC